MVRVSSDAVVHFYSGDAAMKNKWMRGLVFGAVAGGLMGVVATAANISGKPSVASLPPVVVQTIPQSGDTAVDASKVKEIRVTFSKKMTDKSWSWSQISEDTFPEITGKIHYDADGKTCICPVKLEPGKTYVSWLNSQKFGNFKDADGRSAVPYLLVFETK